MMWKHSVIGGLAVGTIASGALAAPSGPAKLFAQIREVGSDVVFTANGKLDLTGITPLQYAGVAAAMFKDPSYETIWTTPGYLLAPRYAMNLVSSTGPIFSSSLPNTSATSGSGYAFGLLPIMPTATQFGVDPGYVSGTAFSATGTWGGKSFSSLNLVQGKHTWSYGPANNTITLQVGSVPEPGEWAAMGILGAGLAGLVLRRRRR
jgi:hypothetical protein